MLNRALRLVRNYHDLSLTAASERVGLSKSYVSEIESGTKRVTLDVLEKYAIAFNLPVSSLLLFSENMERQNISEVFRLCAADKVLSMLEWIAKDEK